jgi:hypothetical protein
MEQIASNGTMLSMSTPTVTESPLRLEPVTADDFISDLTGLSVEAKIRPAAPARPATVSLRPRPRRRGLRLRVRSHVASARPVAA